MQVNRDIVDALNDDIVGGILLDVPLTKRGASSYVGICPFHAERSPSFHVHSKKNIFKCFGCGESGDLIAFKQKFHKLSFTESIDMLASEKGMKISHKDVIEIPDGEAECYVINDRLQSEYLSHRRTEYLTSRGLSEQTISFFGIGYSNGVTTTEDMAKSGMLSEKGNELMRNRITFPIKNKYGRVIAFGGRTLDERWKEKKIPKYLNTGASLVYDKSRTLFNLWNAEQHIKDKKVCIVVEGYMDVVGLWDKGIYNVVGVCGTSFTELQCKEISRMASSIIFAYDNDEAGRKALNRSIGICLRIGVEPSYVLLKADPDEVVMKIGKDGFEFILSNAKNYIEEFISTYEGCTNTRQTELIAVIKSNLQHCVNPIFKIGTIRRICERLGLPTSVIDESMGRFMFHTSITIIEIDFEDKFLKLLNSYSDKYVNDTNVVNIMAGQMNNLDCFSSNFNTIIASICAGDMSGLELYEKEKNSDMEAEECLSHMIQVYEKQVVKCMIKQNRNNISNAKSDEELEVYLKAEDKLKSIIKE